MTTDTPGPADPFEEEGLPAGMDLADDRKRITGDQQEGIPAPSNRAAASLDYGTTADEERSPEPLDRRLGREIPDVTPQDTLAGEAPDAATPYPEDRDERGGRLVAPDEGVHTDDEPDAVARTVGTDTGGFTGEERAVRVEEEA
jgi:hypothetical protein